MKFLHISDLHIGKRVNEFSMIEDQKYILRQIKEIALEKQVDAVMIAGDIYDKPVPSAEAVQLFDQFLHEDTGIKAGTRQIRIYRSFWWRQKRRGEIKSQRAYLLL